ncbi:hypothetical protein Ancab_021261 [Ancistrocladus abbreviatus]
MDKHARFHVFKANVHHIHRVNKMGKPYKLRLNRYGDMTNTEFPNLYGSKIKQYQMVYPRANTRFVYENAEVEGINQMKTNQLVSLSEQELVDYDHDNGGCNGGLMENAFAFIKKIVGLTTKKTYAY